MKNAQNFLKKDRNGRRKFLKKNKGKTQNIRTKLLKKKKEKSQKVKEKI